MTSVARTTLPPRRHPPGALGGGGAGRPVPADRECFEWRRNALLCQHPGPIHGDPLVWRPRPVRRSDCGPRLQVVTTVPEPSPHVRGETTIACASGGGDKSARTRDFPPPATNAVRSSRSCRRRASGTRGEEGAPRLSARTQVAVVTRAQPSAVSRLARQVGVSLATTSAHFTPTRTAIGLSLPVAIDGTGPLGSLSPWHSALPPHSCRRHAFGIGGGNLERGDRPTPDLSRGSTSQLAPPRADG
jgi:hypothetical protein